MFLSGKNPNVLIDTMNTEIEKVLEWLDINKLTLKLKKTALYVFQKIDSIVNENSWYHD